MKISVANYTFNPAQKQIVLNNYPNIKLEQILGIYNATVRRWIYDPFEAGFTVTLSGNTITFATSNAGMNNSDAISIFIEDPSPSNVIIQPALHSEPRILEVSPTGTPLVTSQWLDLRGYSRVSFTPKCTQAPAAGLLTATSIEIRFQWSATNDNNNFSYEAGETVGTVTGGLVAVTNNPKIWTYVLPTGTLPAGGSLLATGILSFPAKKRFIRAEARLNQLLNNPVTLQLIGQLGVL
jgi:hypothetical protein